MYIWLVNIQVRNVMTVFSILVGSNGKAFVQGRVMQWTIYPIC
jgi:hypothetical protein